MPDRLTRVLVDRVVQTALIYTPQLRPGLRVKHALDDELVMVSSYPDATAEDAHDYVFVDWGQEFTHAHAVAPPRFTFAGLTMSLGEMVVDYIMYRKAKAYLPARSVMRRLDAGNLHIVSDAPRFLYAVWVIWREDLEDD